MTFRRYLLALCFLAMVAFGSGCVDDPTVPVPVERTFSSRGGLVDAFGDHLRQGTMTGFEDIFHEDFRFEFSPGDVLAFDLPTSYMYSGEMQAAFGNLFSGRVVENFRGESIPEVQSLEVENLEQITVWAPVPTESAFPEAWTARYWARLRVDLADEIPPLSFISILDFYCDEVTPDSGTYRLAGLSEVFSTLETGSAFSFGSLSFRYFTNAPPAVVLDLTDISAPDSPRILVNGCGSWDRENQYGPLTYRWALAADGPWSFWGEDCVVEIDLPDFGEHTFHMEVRDRWGGISGASAPIIFCCDENTP